MKQAKSWIVKTEDHVWHIIWAADEYSATDLAISRTGLAVLDVKRAYIQESA